MLATMKTDWVQEDLVVCQTRGIGAKVGLSTWQQHQLEQFNVRGFPTRKEEGWRYLPIVSLTQTPFTMPEPCAVPASEIDPFKIPGACCLVFVNGIYSESLSTVSVSPDTVTIKSLQQALEDDRDAVLSVLDIGVPDAFGHLNAGLLTGGVWIDIPPEVHVRTPIQILHVATQITEPQMRHPRHVVRVGQGSTVTIYETYQPDASVFAGIAYWTNTITQIFLEHRATCHFTKLQLEQFSAKHLSLLCVQQKKDSQFDAFHALTGAALSRENIQVRLLESGAQCHVRGVTYLDQLQQGQLHLDVRHIAPKTKSQQTYKGIYGGRSQGTFDGKIWVYAEAQKVVAHQKNQNILLTETAAVNTKPALEIYAEDVVCSHGATVGQLDPEALFYCRTRGMSDELAQQVLMKGFVEALFDEIAANPFCDMLRHVIERRWSA